MGFFRKTRSNKRSQQTRPRSRFGFKTRWERGCNFVRLKYFSNIAFATMEDTLKPFIKCVFPDPEEWRGIRIGAVFMFWRGLFPEFSRLVAHGTPLSIAFQIVREGIVVGNGTHYKNGSSRTGYFVMHGGSTNIRVQEARNRSTSWRCAEYQIDTWPSSWTVPCVLTWEPWHGSTVTKLVRLHNDCWKACIESSAGTRRRMPHSMSLWIIGYEL